MSTATDWSNATRTYLRAHTGEHSRGALAHARMQEFTHMDMRARTTQIAGCMVLVIGKHECKRAQLASMRAHLCPLFWRNAESAAT
eukprot:11913008-Alexandrium_andersonii.AAC.1